MELIFGIHSIKEAIFNPNRNSHELYATEKGLTDFLEKNRLKKSDLKLSKLLILDSHQIHEAAKKFAKESDFEIDRVPSQIFLRTTPLEIKDVTWLYAQIKNKNVKKIIALDQITDVHNMGAICRTASFYGVDAVLFSQKNDLKLSPAFFRIASGSSEYLSLVKTNNLPKTIAKLLEYNSEVVGFCETGDEAGDTKLNSDECVVLVLGAEDTGLSFAVKRLLVKKFKFTPKGKIQTLNVSVAAAVAMEKFF
ncbi:MAG: TrmH family RNA methyltransferase [Bacteriovoracaceae bacterium]